jgi:hypothetical protein
MRIKTSRKAAVALLTGALGVGLVLSNAAAAGAQVRPALAGYVVKTVSFTATNGQQTTHSLSCPAGDVVLSGGAVPVGFDRFINLNSSYAKGRAWVVWVNNSSGSDDSVSETAVCASASAFTGLQTVTKVVKLAANHDSGIQLLQCPSGKWPLGGGVYSTDSSLNVNLTQSYPNLGAAGWDASAYNQAGKPDSMTISMLCAQPPTGYWGSGGTGVDNPAGTQTTAGAPACPTGTVALSGGLASTTDGPNVWLNGSGPNSGTWIGFEDNNGTADNTITAAVLCAA